MTLPLGMNLSTKILTDLSKINLKNTSQKELHKIQFTNQNDDFSSLNVRDINVLELADEKLVTIPS